MGGEGTCGPAVLRPRADTAGDMSATAALRVSGYSLVYQSARLHRFHQSSREVGGSGVWGKLLLHVFVVCKRGGVARELRSLEQRQQELFESAPGRW